MIYNQQGQPFAKHKHIPYFQVSANQKNVFVWDLILPVKKSTRKKTL